VKAGRMLDALVAEKVMSKVIHPDLRDAVCYGGGPPMVIAGPDPEAFPKSELNCQWGDVPRYSTDIAAAWEVVDAITCVQFAVEWCCDGHGWDARFAIWNSVKEDVEVCKGWGDSAPHAICLAALKAVGAL
jgi:hypothetical protein